MVCASPNRFNEDEQIEVKVSGIDISKWGVDDIYLWTWYFDSNDVEVNSNVNWNGEWNNSKESMKMTKNQDGSFHLNLSQQYYIKIMVLEK